jgi:hypothetical protein
MASQVWNTIVLLRATRIMIYKKDEFIFLLLVDPAPLCDCSIKGIPSHECQMQLPMIVETFNTAEQGFECLHLDDLGTIRTVEGHVGQDLLIDISSL